MRDIDTLGMSDRARDEVFWRRTVLAFLYFACLKPLSKLSNGFRSGRLALYNRFTREPAGCSWDSIAPGSLFAKNNVLEEWSSSFCAGSGIPAFDEAVA